jgi:CheY-like chemotaxis protein
VHAIVRGHGGFVNVYSEPGRGASFRIYLPAEVAPGLQESVAESRAAPELGAGECILVVDDEAPLRQVARRALERFGYRVLLAEHGAAAVSLFAVHRGEIALVLTDMSMPVMDGPATILALRAIDPAVRVVGMSGLSDASQVARTTGAGLRHFLPKPFTADDLLRVLREALGEPA